jgi:DNA-binding PadR family transcriptional regulator
VRAAILALLDETPMHGYQVIQELSGRSGGMWRPSPGSVYPTLQLLEDEGLVRSEDVEGKRVFHLTDAGKAQAAKRGAGAPAPWEMGADTEPFAEMRNLGFGVVTALMQVVHSGNETQIEKAREILSEARRNLYRLLAEDEPTDA